MPPTIVTPNTTWSSSSWYILQDYNNRNFILTSDKDDFLRGQLQSTTMGTTYNISYSASNSTGIAGLSGPKLSYNDSFFLNAGIEYPANTTFDVVKYNKLINLPTPLGYVEVIWGNADKNLARQEEHSPKVAGDVTVNISKLTNAVVDKPVFVFMVSSYNSNPATDPLHIFRVYKKKNKADFEAEIKNELNYAAQSSSLGIYNGITAVTSTPTLRATCNSDKYRSPGCSISFLQNKTIIGKLRFTLYNLDMTKVLHYGYATLQDMQSSNHFKDYLNVDQNAVCIYEGYISLPYTDTYTFASSHDDGVIINLNNVEIINNERYGNDTSNGYYMPTGTYTFKVKLTNTGGPGAVNVQYKTLANTTLTDIPTAWFSTTYFINMADYLQNIYNIQSKHCSNNLNNKWCQTMSKLNTTDSSDIYKKYCISNSKYLADYGTCKDYYTEGTNDFTTAVKGYCTDSSRLFIDTPCIPTTSLPTVPQYLSAAIWEGRKTYCDSSKFSTDDKCKQTIAKTENISLFDKLLGDNCTADKLTTEPCKSASEISKHATDFTKLPYYTFQGINKCIKDGKLDISSQFCKDTANDIYSKKGAYLMKPVMEYCGGTTTANGVTTNNITNSFCTDYMNAHKCTTSGFTGNREETCEQSNMDRYYSIFIFILIMVVSIVLIKLNFKIDNIYKEYTNPSLNEGQ